jgi:hypothetical protein
MAAVVPAHIISREIFCNPGERSEMTGITWRSRRLLAHCSVMDAEARISCD